MKFSRLIVLVFLAPVAYGQVAEHSKETSAVTIGNSQASTTPAKVDMDQDATAAPTAKINPEKEAAIRRLFNIVGTRATMEEVLSAMTDNMKPTLSQMLPPGEYQEKLIPLFFEQFHSKLKTADLLDIAVRTYDKYFSREDIDGLAQFYQTPLGKKVSSVLPQVIVESQEAGRKMGEEIGRKSMLCSPNIQNCRKL